MTVVKHSIIIKWAEDFLVSHGYTISNQAEDVQITPWSSVIRFLTSQGYIYLKQTPPAISLEPEIAKILYEQFQANVPWVLAINKELNCFLMNDLGVSLRSIFKQKFQTNLLCEGIKEYSDIQYAVVNHIKLFLDLGAPDWRLEKLPAIYSEFISEKELLIADGLTSEELNSLHKLQSEFSSMCELLSRYKVPQTLDHCDFHDNNIVIDNKTHQISIVDWGESVITHPFFSLINCLTKVSYLYSLQEKDSAYLALQNAGFKNWREFESDKNLMEIMSLTKKLWPIYESLAQYRLVVSSNKEEFKALNRQGRLTRGLKDFIKISSL